jgi:hypothetical protein
MDDRHHASFKETGSYLEMLEPLREYVVDKIINPRHTSYRIYRYK